MTETLCPYSTILINKFYPSNIKILSDSDPRPNKFRINLIKSYKVKKRSSHRQRMDAYHTLAYTRPIFTKAYYNENVSE